MQDYYYLISSLHDPELDSQKKLYSLEEFISFCEEQLKPQDFEDLKKVFIFNDLMNIIKVKDYDSAFNTPSYYAKETFFNNMADYSQFFPFIEIFLENKKNEKRNFPDLTDTDELITLFYENIDSLTKNKFLKKYFQFELDLKNISNSISLKKLGISAENALIPSGEAYDRLVKSMPLDHGLIPMLEKLTESLNTSDLTGTEKLIDEIKWLWLDEELSYNYFSFNYIISYAVKLASVERWKRLTEESGKEVLDGLINKIKSGIKFSEEFLKTGGKR